MALLIRLDRIFISTLDTVKLLFATQQGLPLKIADDKVMFLLAAKYPIQTSDKSDKV